MHTEYKESLPLSQTACPKLAPPPQSNGPMGVLESGGLCRAPALFRGRDPLEQLRTDHPPRGHQQGEGGGGRGCDIRELNIQGPEHMPQQKKARTHAHKHARAPVHNTCAHILTHVRTYARTHAHTHTRPCERTDKNSHPHTHAHTHMHNITTRILAHTGSKRHNTKFKI